MRLNLPLTLASASLLPGWLILSSVLGRYEEASDGFTEIGLPFTFYRGFSGKCFGCPSTGVLWKGLIADFLIVLAVGFLAGLFFGRRNNLNVRSFLIIVLCSVVAPVVHAQEVPFFKKYDSVVYEKVQINGVPMLANKKDVVKKIGKPQKITKYRNDSNDDHWFEYRYGTTILQVLDDGDFYGYKLKTPVFTWRYGVDSVKVGDAVTGICKYFPASCRTLKAGKGELLRVRVQGTDKFIQFWVKNNVVTSIETWEDL